AIELRLTRQDNLQQLASAGLHVAQHTNFFEHVPAQVVGFVHDQHRGSPAVCLLQEKLVQSVQDVGLRLAIAPQIQIVGDHVEELIGREAGTKDERELDVLGIEEIAQALQH